MARRERSCLIEKTEIHFLVKKLKYIQGTIRPYGALLIQGLKFFKD